MVDTPQIPDPTLRMSENKRRLLTSLPALLIGLAFGLGKIVRDCSLTCNVGYQLAPVAIIAIALLSIPVSVLAVRFASRIGYKRWQMWSLGLIALSFFIFWAAAYSIIGKYPGSADTFVDNGGKLPVRLIYLGFFVWLGAVGTIIAPNIKSTVYRVFRRTGRMKALAVTNAAVICGGLIGGGFWRTLLSRWPCEILVCVLRWLEICSSCLWELSSFPYSQLLLSLTNYAVVPSTNRVSHTLRMSCTSFIQTWGNPTFEMLSSGLSLITVSSVLRS